MLSSTAWLPKAERQRFFFTRPGRLDTSAVAAAIAKEGISVTFRRVGSRTVATLGFDKDVRLRASGQGDVFTLDVFASTPDTASAKSPGGDDPLHADVSVEKKAQATVITINWPARVSAASFRYGDYVWVVFGGVARIDLGAIRKNLGAGIEDVELTTLDNATIMRFRAEKTVAARLVAEGWQWKVTLGRQTLRPRTNMFIYAEPNAPGGGRVVIRTGAASSVLTIEDPIVGVPLVIVPVAAPGLGVGAGRLFPKFAILQSSQGLVLVPSADDVSVEPTKGGIMVSHPRGLALGGAPQK